MIHPLDRPIASEFTQRVIEKRNSEVQLPSSPLDKPHQALQPCVFDECPSDQPSIRDGYQGEGHRLFVVEGR